MISKGQWINSFNEWFDRFFIIIIILIGLLLRLRFFIGISRYDPFLYILSANDILAGEYSPTYPIIHIYRYALIVPNLILSPIVNSLPVVYALYPLACSLAGIYFIYKIGNRLWNSDAGLIAACIYAVINWLDITLATQLLPDAITPFIFILAFYLVLPDALDQEPKNWRFFFSGILVGVSYSLRITNPILILPVLIGVAFWKRYRSTSYLLLLLGVFTLPMIEMAYLWVASGNPFQRFIVLQYAEQLNQNGGYPSKLPYFFELIFLSNEFSIFYYVVIISFISLLIKLKSGRFAIILLLGWGLYIYLFLEIGYYLLRTAAKEDRMLSPLWIPSALIVGLIVSKLTEKYSLWKYGYLGGIALILLISRVDKITQFLNSNWNPQLIILICLLILGMVAYLFSRAQKIGMIAWFLLFVIFGIQAYHSSESFLHWIRNYQTPYQKVSELLLNYQNANLYTNTFDFALRFNYFATPNLALGTNLSTNDYSEKYQWIPLSKHKFSKNREIILVSNTLLDNQLELIGAKKLLQEVTNSGELIVYEINNLDSLQTKMNYLGLGYLNASIGNFSLAQMDFNSFDQSCEISECGKTDLFLRQTLDARLKFQRGDSENARTKFTDILIKLKNEDSETTMKITPFIIWQSFLNKFGDDLVNGQIQDNEISNHDFEYGLAHWLIPDKEIFRADYQVSKDCAFRGDLGGYIRGNSDAYHNGMKIKLDNLIPGSYIVVGGMFKTGRDIFTKNQELRINTNYLQGETNEGKPSGVYSPQIIGNIGWTSVVRIVKLPDDLINFYYYPALLTGIGHVCIDDVFVVTLN